MTNCALPPKADPTMTDEMFWIEVRRGLLFIARALARRYKWKGLRILLNDKDD